MSAIHNCPEAPPKAIPLADIVGYRIIENEVQKCLELHFLADGSWRVIRLAAYGTVITTDDDGTEIRIRAVTWLGGVRPEALS